MANLSITKALFGFTSPRTIEKIIPEIEVLCKNFSGVKWSGNEKVQIDFFRTLYDSEYYEGEAFPTDPALAARDRITRAPKAFGFVDLEPEIKLTQAGELLLSEKRLDETFTRQLLKFQLPSPYHTQSKTVVFNIRPYLECKHSAGYYSLWSRLSGASHDIAPLRCPASHGYDSINCS